MTYMTMASEKTAAEVAKQVLNELIDRIFEKDVQNSNVIQKIREEHEELVTCSLVTISNHYEKLFKQLRDEQDRIIVEVQNNLEKKLEELRKIEENIEELRDKNVSKLCREKIATIESVRVHTLVQNLPMTAEIKVVKKVNFLEAPDPSSSTDSNASDFDISDMPDVPGDVVEHNRSTKSSSSKIKYEIENLRAGSTSSIGSEAMSSYMSEEDDDFDPSENLSANFSRSNKIGVTRWDSNVSTLTGIRPFYQKKLPSPKKSSPPSIGRTFSTGSLKRRAPPPPSKPKENSTIPRAKTPQFENRPIVHESPFNLQPIRVLGAKGKGNGAFLRPPKGITLIPGGGCWAVDKGRVVVFNSSWEATEPIKINAAAKPTCLTVTPDKSIAMVCKRTVTLWTASGTLTSTFTHPDFKDLHGVCIDREGRYVLTDLEKNSVTVFGATGKLFSFGSFGPKNDQFKSPSYVTTGPDNRIYVSDHHNHCVKIFSDKGEFLSRFGRKGRGDGELSFPEGIVFLDWANGLLVADEGNNRIDFYTAEGKFRNHILVEVDGIIAPRVLVINEDRLLMVSSQSHHIKLFDLSAIRFAT